MLLSARNSCSISSGSQPAHACLGCRSFAELVCCPPVLFLRFLFRRPIALLLPQARSHGTGPRAGWRRLPSRTLSTSSRSSDPPRPNSDPGNQIRVARSPDSRVKFEASSQFVRSTISRPYPFFILSRPFA